MNRIRTSWNRLVETLQSYRLRLSLTIGLLRLRRWKSRLLPLMQKMRLALGNPRRPQEPQELMELLRLPQELEPAPATLEWALVTLEDLYLLLLEQEKAMESLLSTLKRP
jgi:hypothetical protein